MICVFILLLLSASYAEIQIQLKRPIVSNRYRYASDTENNIFVAYNCQCKTTTECSQASHTVCFTIVDSNWTSMTPGDVFVPFENTMPYQYGQFFKKSDVISKYRYFNTLDVLFVNNSFVVFYEFFTLLKKRDIYSPVDGYAYLMTSLVLVEKYTTQGNDISRNIIHSVQEYTKDYTTCAKYGVGRKCLEYNIFRLPSTFNFDFLSQFTAANTQEEYLITFIAISVLTRTPQYNKVAMVVFNSDFIKQQYQEDRTEATNNLFVNVLDNGFIVSCNSTRYYGWVDRDMIWRFDYNYRHFIYINKNMKSYSVPANCFTKTLSSCNITNILLSTYDDKYVAVTQYNNLYQYWFYFSDDTYKNTYKNKDDVRIQPFEPTISRWITPRNTPTDWNIMDKTIVNGKVEFTIPTFTNVQYFKDGIIKDTDDYVIKTKQVSSQEKKTLIENIVKRKNLNKIFNNLYLTSRSTANTLNFKFYDVSDTYDYKQIYEPFTMYPSVLPTTNLPTSIPSIQPTNTPTSSPYASPTSSPINTHFPTTTSPSFQTTIIHDNTIVPTSYPTTELNYSNFTFVDNESNEEHEFIAHLQEYYIVYIIGLSVFTISSIILCIFCSYKRRTKGVSAVMIKDIENSLPSAPSINIIVPQATLVTE